jgi:hypothetical protein
MKKIIFLSLVVFTITTLTTRAQSFHIGIKAGGSATKLDGQPFSNGFNFAYHAGAFAEINFSRKWGIQPELLFSQSSTKTLSNVNQITFPENTNLQLNYLSIPILLNFRPAKLITFQLGPQFSILTNKNDNLTTSAQNAFKNGDFAMAGGVQFNLGTLKIYGRYLIGLNSVSDVTAQNSWKSQQIQAGVALKLF